MTLGRKCLLRIDFPLLFHSFHFVKRYTLPTIYVKPYQLFVKLELFYKLVQSPYRIRLKVYVLIDFIV